MHWPEIQRLAADVARLTVGLPPLPPATPGPQLVWWLWRAAALLLIAGWGWGIWRLPRRRRQLLAARSAGVRWPATTLASISINLLIVIAVPLALFHFTGLTIPALLVVQADAGWLLVAGLAVAVVRLVGSR